MKNKDAIIDHLRGKLELRDDVHAFWVEGSSAQGYADEFSDIDLWVSVDDDKIFTIYDDIELLLSEFAPIDFRYVLKNNGDIGHVVYHLHGTGKFLTIDFNTQGISRDVHLAKGIDSAEIMFDKRDVVKFKERRAPYSDDQLDASRQRLRDYYWYMETCLIKNVRRGRKLEALHYYHLILRYATKFLRLRYGWHEKTGYDLKHVYRDIPAHDVKNLERFYDVRIDDVEAVLPELEAWLNDL